VGVRNRFIKRWTLKESGTPRNGAFKSRFQGADVLGHPGGERKSRAAKQANFETNWRLGYPGSRSAVKTSLERGHLKKTAS